MSRENCWRQRLAGTLAKELHHRRSTPRIRGGEAWSAGKETKVHAGRQASRHLYISQNIIWKKGGSSVALPFVKKSRHTSESDTATRRRVMSIFRNLVITRSRPLCSLLRSCATPVTLLSMPPKRAASSSKRKAESDSDGGKPIGSKTAKKTKVSAAPTPAEDSGLAPNGQPTNKVFPVKISFPPRSERATRIASWNVLSLASSQKKVGLTCPSWSSRKTDGCDPGFQALCRG